MHVSLTEVLDKYVKELVASGHYNNASEVIREALRLKIEQDQVRRAKLEALRQNINVAWEQLDRGEGIDYDLDRLLGVLESERAAKADV